MASALDASAVRASGPQPTEKATATAFSLKAVSSGTVSSASSGPIALNGVSVLIAANDRSGVSDRTGASGPIALSARSGQSADPAVHI